MSWYAIDELEEAVDDTKDILFPFSTGTWARLFLIVIITGQGFSIPNMPTAPSGTGGPGSYDDAYGSSASHDTGFAANNMMTGMSTAAASAGFGAAVLAAIFTLVGLVLGFFFVSSVFEFIYYQSLLDKDVSIRSNFRKHWKKGARYFGLRLGAFLVALLTVAAVIAGFALNVAVGAISVLAVLVAFIPFLVFLGLTQDFILLKMIEKDLGLIAAWRDFWPELRQQWREVLVYLLVKFGLGIAFGIAGFLWLLITLLILLIPFGILGALFYLAAPVLVAIPALLGLITWAVLVVGLQIVLQTFLYNYAIRVYSDLTA